MGPPVRFTVGITEFLHVLLFQGEVGFRVIAQALDHTAIRTRLANLVENIEQHLMLYILPKDVTGYSHAVTLTTNKSICHDAGQ
jgi:hypothetical protein